MPTYDFVCKDCNKKFRITCRIDEYEPRKVACPACHAKKVERVWTPVFVETAKKS